MKTSSLEWMLKIIVIVYLIEGVLGDNCTDPCSRPLFCETGEWIANPDNCYTYFWCINSMWQIQVCADNLTFDNSICLCNHPGHNNCAMPCPTTTPRPTYPPAPCDDMPDPCIDEELYADQADCRYFYECQTGVLSDRIECAHNLTNADHTECLPNIPCVFDIVSKKCINPYPDFDCYYRCPTQGTTLLWTGTTHPVTDITSSADESTTWVEDTTTDIFDTTTIPLDTTTQTLETSTDIVDTTELEDTTIIKTTTGEIITPGSPGTHTGVIVGTTVVGGGIGIAVCVLLVLKLRKGGNNDDHSSENTSEGGSDDLVNDEKPLVMTTMGTKNMLWRSAPGATKGIQQYGVNQSGTFPSSSKKKKVPTATLR